MTSKPRDPYGALTATDLQLVARPRGIHLAAPADRDEMVAQCGLRIMLPIGGDNGG